ncbi:flagellar basal body rod protein [Alicyclobacillus sp. TC]|uniref:Flagellar basal body rod protein FlgG n=1 Tax=Alicyclobacillus tolerans TaxID=90970 RepID=A0ABT9LTZ5_9BACL|nr:MULTISPECIES: flagellar basal body rod C-terminal domain-containing protein [Alicyclobacillus]MDP9727734.1 flagellar basal body rod protein FlgG [Alicyclobacillus tengchongensis]QRF24418.1 flagellar basal body rod protein [Alicyclobacillus sp. TC]
MIRALTTAAAGMLTEERLQAALANDLANLNTPGFKEILGSAREYPVENLYQSQDGQLIQPIGQMGTGVLFQEGVPLWSEGQLNKTDRSLDVAIQDNTPPGPYAAVNSPGGQAVSVAGPVTVGTGGRLTVNQQPLAVLNASGKPVPGWYAMKNPQYTGTSLYAADGMPNYDAAGQPSYLFANAQGQVLAVPGTLQAAGLALRIGTSNDMGQHSFYAVAYTSADGQSGVVLTRDGHFSVNAQHELVDAAGHPILPVGSNGMPIVGARIIINPNYTGQALFASDGQAVRDAAGQLSYTVVGQNGQSVTGAKLGTVNADVTQVTPLGATEFEVGGSFATNTALSHLQPGTGTLMPGYLEGSNVNATNALVQMQQILNLYQANQQVLSTENSTLGVAAEDIGKIP